MDILHGFMLESHQEIHILAETQADVSTPSRVFGRQVRQARELLRWSQAELAEHLAKLGVTMHQATIARLEGGERRVSVDDAMALAAALGVSPLFLFSGAYTGEAVDVTPKVRAATGQMEFWLRGVAALPGTDHGSFAAIVPRHVLLARQRAGIQHLEALMHDFIAAAAAKDRRAALDAINGMQREIERQTDELERDMRVREEESNDG